ncbi:SGNH hydrolase-type esterase domain containing protein [Candidatus Methylopumilus universalis]|uniref:DUF459 domain-containing protein n=1 Tax=Candidatus Methylopumilus universalis TaxID=2588536 RepID=UPI003BEEC40B
MKFLIIKFILLFFVIQPFVLKAVELDKKILIVGDSLADGLWLGINNDRDRIKKENLIIFKGSIQGQTITGMNFFSYIDKVSSYKNDFGPDYIIIFIGANDQTPNFSSKKVGNFTLENWKSQFKRNAITLIDSLKMKPEKVYWVSLPIMRDVKTNQDAQIINQILKEIGAEKKINIVDIEKEFTDNAGSFVMALNINNKFMQIRADDGIHFTTAGYKLISRKLVLH